MERHEAKKILQKIFEACRSRKECRDCPFILPTLKSCAFSIMPCYWIKDDIQEKTRTEQPCPCDTCQTRIDRCGCQMNLCSDYQKWKEGDEK